MALVDASTGLDPALRHHHTPEPTLADPRGCRNFTGDLVSLGGWIRTNDIFRPREVGYQAAPHLEIGMRADLTMLPHCQGLSFLRSGIDR